MTPAVAELHIGLESIVAAADYRSTAASTFGGQQQHLVLPHVYQNFQQLESYSSLATVHQLAAAVPPKSASSMLPKVLSRGLASRTAVAVAVKQQQPARAQLPVLQSLCTGPGSSQQQAARTLGSSASAESLKASSGAADADKARKLLAAASCIACTHQRAVHCWLSPSPDSKDLKRMAITLQHYLQPADRGIDCFVRGQRRLASTACWPTMSDSKTVLCNDMRRSTSRSWGCRTRSQSCWRARAPTTTSRWTPRP